MFCLHVCLCTMYVPGATGGQKKSTRPPGAWVTNSLSSHVGEGIETSGREVFTLSHLSGPVYSSFYYKFDTLLEESWWIITTRKRNLKRFSHTHKNYLGSQAIRLTSQQGDLLSGDYWIKRLKGTRPAAHTQGNGVSPLTHAHTVALGHSSLHM